MTRAPRALRSMVLGPLHGMSSSSGAGARSGDAAARSGNARGTCPAIEKPMLLVATPAYAASWRDLACRRGGLK
jgi:hypothetical protein